ncbi:hypothetical protein Psi01_35420 [Planobispora siamensis]|uniref:protein-serine/threonine phosphatase n=2 Tax=Planobispora siamensis TaxID=936338 RepID=A0A8J3WLW1_9ACTN|nr:hypothetical protein Psi01_35420 [Planobispora siamensis]
MADKAGTADEHGDDDGTLPDGALLRAVFADLGAGVYLTDHTGRITAVNPRAVTLLGRPAAALLGAEDHDLLHRGTGGEVIPRTACQVAEVLEHGRVVRGEIECDTFLDGGGHLLPVAWVASPIRRDGRIRGAAVLFVDATDRQAAARRQADQLAALEDLTERLTALTEITTVLTQTLDVDEALGRLGRLTVPRLADWAAVDLYAGPHDIRRVTIAAPQGHGGGQVWQGPLPPLTDSSQAPLAHVLRSGEAVLLGPDDVAAPADTPLAVAHRELYTAFGAASMIIAPLRTSRQVLGALTVARVDPAHPFDVADLTLITDIGRRAGLAVDNARLFGQQRDVAETMQRHLLAPLPCVDHLGLAARYRPAPKGSQVGGDWYDAFLLMDGVTALVIGDVAGHDLKAAADMAQLRNMLRSLAWDRREPPSVIIDRLDNAMIAVSDIPMATMVMARVEGPQEGPWQLHWVSAGHPPPLLVTADGHTRYLESGQNLLLGVGLEDGTSRYDAIEPLPERSTLLLYTDGLIETAGADLDVGMNRLRRHAAALACRPLDEFCDQLLERMASDGTDDIALLAMRLPGAGTGADV